VTLVLVSREPLEQLIRELYGVSSGSVTPDICDRLHPDDPIVTLAVEAGIQIPGPLTGPPPAPPERASSDGAQHAPTFRRFNDPRLRCTEDGKVVYGTQARPKLPRRGSRSASR
jgi:hypothetical protein